MKLVVHARPCSLEEILVENSTYTNNTRLKDKLFYQPTERGLEAKIAERLRGLRAK